ncbi:MAG: metallophosphoesterase [Anaerolineales bacterium]|nr:metallophosphoesterase [Anaerolineales bacterium]
MNTNVNGERGKSKPAVTRRDFLRLLKVAGLDLALLTFGGSLYMSKYEPSWLDVTELKLKLPRLPKSFSGFRLAQITDLHFGGWMDAERLDEVLSAVSSLSPDLLAITGDFTLGHFRRSQQDDQKRYADLVRVLSSYTGEYLTVGTKGNHDYWVDPSAMQWIFQAGGVVDLNNATHVLKSGGESLYLAGVDNIWYKDDRLDLVQAQIPRDECAILLAHEPDFADTSSLDGRFDLQISGHSHGGQIVLPYFGPPILPRLGKKYSMGLYRVGDMFQYTNRGVGMVPPYVRFNCRPEITVFTLESI